MEKMILINAKGERYDLFDATKSPTYTVEGLGYTDKTAFLQIGGSYFALEEVAEQGVISLALSFFHGADAKYSAFVRHARHAPLTLLYQNDVDTYYFPCRLTSIEKIDQPRYKCYVCPVSFTLTGNPYCVKSLYTSSDVGEGKSYGNTGYTYDYTYSASLPNTIILASDSYVKSPCILTIYGEAVNPIWRHYLDGTLVETGAYSGTIESGHYLVIDTHSMPYSIIEYDGDGVLVADRYSMCDFSTERFMHVNEGENRYVITHDDVTNVSVKLEGYIQYETV